MMRPSSNWLTGLLLGSVVLNLFLGGWLIGFYWRGEPDALAQVSSNSLPRQPLQSLHWLQQALPDSQKRVQPVFAQQIQGIKPDLKQFHHLQQAIRQELSTEKLDVQVLSQRLAASRQAQHKIQGRMHEALLEAISHLSVQERQKLARAPNILGSRKPRRGRHLQQADKDGDGMLSRTEFIQFHPDSQQAKAEQRFLQLDKDEDGQLTPQEWTYRAVDN